MNYEKIIAEAMRDLKNAEVYEQLASQSRCKARKLLESVNSPAPCKGQKQNDVIQAQVLQIFSRRKKRLLSKAASK